MIRRNIRRGEIYTVDLGEGLGSEHRGHKYCLIIQNDVGNCYSPTTTIIPITSKYRDLPTHVEIDNINGCTSFVKCEHIRTIDKLRIRDKVGQLNPEQLVEVESKILFQLGISI